MSYKDKLLEDYKNHCHKELLEPYLQHDWVAPLHAIYPLLIQFHQDTINLSDGAIQHPFDINQYLETNVIYDAHQLKGFLTPKISDLPVDKFFKLVKILQGERDKVLSANALRSALVQGLYHRAFQQNNLSSLCQKLKDRSKKYQSQYSKHVITLIKGLKPSTTPWIPTGHDPTRKMLCKQAVSIISNKDILKIEPEILLAYENWKQLIQTHHTQPQPQQQKPSQKTTTYLDRIDYTQKTRAHQISLRRQLENLIQGVRQLHTHQQSTIGGSLLKGEITRIDEEVITTKMTHDSVVLGKLFFQAYSEISNLPDQDRGKYFFPLVQYVQQDLPRATICVLTELMRINQHFESEDEGIRLKERAFDLYDNTRELGFAPWRNLLGPNAIDQGIALFLDQYEDEMENQLQQKTPQNQHQNIVSQLQGLRGHTSP